VVRYVIRVANEPARRFKILWYSVAWAIAAIFMVIGAGYLVVGDAAESGSALSYVRSVEHDLRIHGILMMAFSAFLIYGLNDYRRVTRWALFAVFLYALWVAILIFGSFALHASWGAPWWYLFVAALSCVLIILAPPLGTSGRRWGTEGSGGA
jgi:hypothetical protein